MDYLKTENLKKIYQHTAVVNQINIEVKSGEIVGLLGRNGAGKTTTFLMLSGIIKPDSGGVFLNNEDIINMPSHFRAQKGLIYMPQQHSVFLKATAFENLFFIFELSLKKETARLKSLELLDEFGLMYVKDSKAYQLSGGEKRRLEIARAMIMKPKFLFLDEPFTGIDPITILEIQKIILRLKNKNIGIIITDHNVKDTFNITDRVYIIHQGEILSSGSPEEIVKTKKARELFLGKDFEWTMAP
jgi:lipopolysaccharide export system ATP-binding protein